jgi:hypothetical protein
MLGKTSEVTQRWKGLAIAFSEPITIKLRPLSLTHQTPNSLWSVGRTDELCDIRDHSDELLGWCAADGLCVITRFKLDDPM